jgi:hypothetical protein
VAFTREGEAEGDWQLEHMESRAAVFRVNDREQRRALGGLGLWWTLLEADVVPETGIEPVRRLPAEGF